MHVLVIDHNSVHKPLIAKLIAQKLPKVSQISFATTHELRETDVTKADLVIVSGGTWLVQKNPGVHRRINDLIVRAGKPAIGICLGAEAFAQYFGMGLSELETRVSGSTDIQLGDELAAYVGQDSLRVYEHHRYAFSAITDNIEVLATSPTGIEAFRHKTLPIVGLQFHPEVRRQYNEGHKVVDYILSAFNML